MNATHEQLSALIIGLINIKVKLDHKNIGKRSLFKQHVAVKKLIMAHHYVTKYSLKQTLQSITSNIKYTMLQFKRK